MQVDSHHHFWNYDPAQYGWIGSEMSVLKRDFLPAALTD
ncbi:MAG: amidohydrolase, partial [Planctomycetota bacterium]